MIVNRRNRPAHNPQDWSSKSAIARIDKVGAGKRQAEEQLAAVVLNTRRNQARLERALEAGNIVRAGTLAALVAKGMTDAKRLAETLEESGRVTFGKAKSIGHGRVVTMESITAIRPIINWAKGEQEAAIVAVGISPMPHVPKAHTSIGTGEDTVPVLTLHPSAGKVAKLAKRKIRKAKKTS